ncbi:MAG: choline kinase, partial [Methylococcales bacterium]|nr:choline kinase [Methylococcales bacterium]
MKHPKMPATDQAIHFIKSVTGATTVRVGEVLQNLWSGYGSITRIHLDLDDLPTAILKHIEPPSAPIHPLGWNTATSHQRKLHSYEVESNWYRYFSHRCGDACAVPLCLGVGNSQASKFVLLQDLDIEYPRRCSSLSVEECKVCLEWLARFHACFMYDAGTGLWPVGTYWHLATRSEEFGQMEDGPVKESARQIDRMLNSCQHTTLVHGDAKVANFCFSPD